jgi:hypothetical protein
MEVYSVQTDMSNYPNILTPPSSSEDSPQSNFYNSPPSSFPVQENPLILPPTSLAFDFDGIPAATGLPVNSFLPGLHVFCSTPFEDNRATDRQISLSVQV